VRLRKKNKMIETKTNTAQQIIDAIGATAGKVNFINDAALTKAMLYLENKGIPTNKHEDYKYCNIDVILKREFKNLSQKLNSVNSVEEHKLADTVTLVVVNGNYSESLSDKVILKRVTHKSFTNLDDHGKTLLASQANVEKDAFAALIRLSAGRVFI